MDLVVLAKYVPDIDRVPADAWDRERGTLIRSRLEMEFNPLDRIALRLAISIRAGRPGTRVVALSMGPPAAMAMLKEAIAHGADGAVLLSDARFAGADTIATAHALAAGIRRMIERGLIDSDFAVVCGMQSPDGDTAQVPAQVACLLDAPLYPYVCEATATPDRIDFRCLNSVGFQRVTTRRGPFVVTATRLLPDLPFYTDLPSMRRANGAAVAVWGLDDVAADPARVGFEGSRTRVVRIFEPDRRRRAGELIESDSDEFAGRAAAMMRRLRDALRSGGAREEVKPDGGAPTAGPAYYRGDCVALCETADGRLARVSLEVTSSCARLAGRLGCSTVAVVPGPVAQAAADALKACGADQVVFMDGLDAAAFRVRERARALAALLGELRPQIVVAPATLTGRVVAPYISAMLDCGLTADCSALELGDFTRQGRTFGRILHQTRPALGGNIMATIVSVYEDRAKWRPQMATVRPGVSAVGNCAASRCTVRIFRAAAYEARDEVMVERRALDERPVDLAGFDVIVCVGMGVRDRETIDAVVEPFRADLERHLGVPVGLGCSRAMVDAGVLPHAHQVGQTGTVVKPRVYIGLGVSGAIQHKIGMENAGLIVSVNRDASAPMFGFCDYAIVGDVARVLPALRAAMRGAKDDGVNGSGGEPR